MGELLSQFAQWLLNLLLYVPREIFSLLCDGLAGVIEAIPVPAGVSAFGENMAAALSGTGWFADLLALKEGSAIVFSALLARFILRRIPFIGG